MRAAGHVFKYGDNVDTDVIIQRACAAVPEDGGSQLHYRGNFCKDLLPQCH